MAWVAKGVIFTHQQKFEDAVQSFNQALLINPTNQKAIQNREMEKKFIHVPGLTNPNERVEKVPHPLQYGTVSEYKSNILLFIWPFIGAFFFFFGWFGALIFLIGSTFLIYSDAGKLQLGSRPGSLDTRTWKPWEWGLITFLLWIIGYPLYLYKRRAIYEANNNLQRTSTGSAKLIIGVIGFFIIFAIIGAGWSASLQSTSPTGGQADASPRFTSSPTVYQTKSTPTSGEPIDLKVQFAWDKKVGGPDVLTVYGTTNIPDGAGLRGGAWEGKNPDYSDSNYATNRNASIVKDGKFTYTINLNDYEHEANFTDKTILFELSFMPSATGLQPQSITEYYDMGRLLKIKSGSSGFITPGPPAIPEQKHLYYQAFVTTEGNSLKVDEVKDYFKGNF